MDSCNCLEKPGMFTAKPNNKTAAACSQALAMGAALTQLIAVLHWSIAVCSYWSMELASMDRITKACVPIPRDSALTGSIAGAFVSIAF